MRVLLLLIALSLAPLAARADAMAALSCPETLEQIATLKTQQPVYKLAGPEERHFIEDADRPAEIARLQSHAQAVCSKDPATQAKEKAEAEALHMAMSPECAVARDRLTEMQLPSARYPDDVIDKQKKIVADHCPPVNTSGRWLLQWNGRSDLFPDL